MRSYVIDSSVSRFIISSLAYSVLIIFAFCLLRRKSRLRTSCRFLQWPDRYDNNTTPKSLSLLISMFRVQELCCICILHQEYVSAGRGTDLNQMILSSLTYFRLIDQRRSALRYGVTLICKNVCMIDFTEQLISSISFFKTRILSLLFQRTRSRYCSNETLIEFVTSYCN